MVTRRNKFRLRRLLRKVEKKTKRVSKASKERRLRNTTALLRRMSLMLTFFPLK